jgi:hypothetical protein
LVIDKARASDAGTYVAEAEVGAKIVRVALFVTVTNPAWDLITFGTEPNYIYPLKRPRGSGALAVLSERPLLADGRILNWNSFGELVVVEGVSGVVQVSGQYALLAGGSVVVWQRMPWQTDEEVAIPDAAKAGVVALAYDVALRADGMRVALSKSSAGVDLDAIELSRFFPNPSATGTGGSEQVVRELSEMYWGPDSKLALRDDGRLVCEGTLAGRLPILNGLQGVVTIQPNLMLIKSTAPRIVQQPQNQAVTLDEAIRLSVQIQGGIASYQWYRNGEPIEGATESVYQTWGAPGVYTVKVTNSRGSVTSRPARVILEMANPFPAKLVTGFDDGVDFAGYLQTGLGKPFVRGLPPGLKFDPETGLIAGRIGKVGVYSITFGYKSGALLWSKTVKLVVSVSFAGSLEGLLSSGEDAELHGKVNLVITPAGQFTGDLITAIDRRPIPLRGALAPGGIAEVELPGGRQLGLSIASSGHESVARLFSEGGLDPVQIAVGGLHVVGAPAGSPGKALRYTAALLLPTAATDNDARAFPLGGSRATPTLSAKGNLALRGRLAEGTLVTANLSALSNFEYTWFSKVHGPEGYVGGMVSFPEDGGAGEERFAEATGRVRWVKPVTDSVREAVYPAGFSIVTTLRMPRWEAPVKKPVEVTLGERLGLSDGDVLGLSLTGGSPEVQTVTLPLLRFDAAKNALVFAELAADRPFFHFKVDPATGLLSGSGAFAWLPGKAGTDARKWTVDGVALQPFGEASEVIAEGFYLPPNDEASIAERAGCVRLFLDTSH